MEHWIAPASAVAYWGAVGLRAQRLKRRLGRSPNLRARTKKEKFLWAGWGVVSLGWALSPLFAMRLPFEGAVSFYTGLAAVLAGFAGTAWSHASMGDAWRIGVDSAEKTPLVTKGPYSRMRHPLYFFQCLILTGIFLLEPSPVTLFTLFIHRALVSAKVRDEEAHMERLHGPVYKEYRTRTGALWPKV